MPQIFRIIFLVFCATVINSHINNHRKDEILSALQKSFAQRHKPSQPASSNQNGIRVEKYKIVLPKANDFVKSRGYMPKPKQVSNLNFAMDPILNFIKRRSEDDLMDIKLRRDTTSSQEETSSSQEMKNWKTEWREHWIHKKFDAINRTEIKGDVVNMVAARPWGVACGDPNQHDMPWGSCMLPMECEAEYRIYRGDVFCGRTTFVCCALQLTNYDLYQGFDLSFEDSAVRTDSEEKKRIAKNKSGEGSRKKKKKTTQKRKKARKNRKRKIRRAIKKIIKEIRKILNRQYKNGTSQRKRKTKQLKKFIAEMKKKYKKERQSVKDVHESEMIKIDKALEIRLQQIREMNQNFVKNDTFRDIIVNGTYSKKGARMLIEAYPELRTYIPIEHRKSGGGPVEEDYLDYDIEYGMLYY